MTDRRRSDASSCHPSSVRTSREILSRRRGAVAVGWPLRSTMTSQVDAGDRVPAATELLGDAAPQECVGGKTMNQDEGA